MWGYTDGRDNGELVTGEPRLKRRYLSASDQKLGATLPLKLRSLAWVAEARPDLFGHVLFQYSRRRRRRVRSEPGLLPQPAWATMALVPHTDSLREPLQVGWDPVPRVTTWPGHIFDEIDMLIHAHWLLRVGMTAPAALLTRSLLERWTANVAFSHGVERLPGEEEEAFISRTWLVYDRPDFPRVVGAWWATLSEVCHGRLTAGRLGSKIVGHIDADPLKNTDLHEGISAVLELVFRQMRGALASIVRDAGAHEHVPMLQAKPPLQAALDEPFDISWAYEDLEYFEAHRVRSEQWIQLAAIYRSSIRDPERRLTERFDWELAFGSLLERRGRAIERARIAFAEERDVPDHELNPGELAARMFRHECFVEVGFLLAAESNSAERLALLTGSQALATATHLWLEDLDASMGCVRIVLEQTARLRAHRLKRSRAERQEQRNITSASRWVELAGWGRLTALVRAVNEFAHSGAKTQRAGARQILLLLQGSDPHPQQSRKAALEAAAQLFALEVNARLRAVSPQASEQFIEHVTLQSEEEQLRILEDYLENAHRLRNYDFGAADSLDEM